MSFNEYYQFYLNKHTNKYSRRLHMLGQVATLVYIGVVLAYLSWWFLLLAPFVIYPFAVPGHYFYEGNKPAFFSSNPLRAKAADLRMMWDIITGKLEF